MDSTGILPNILKIMISYKKKGVRNDVKLSHESDEHTELIGFMDSKMVLRRKVIIDKKISKYSISNQKVPRICIKSNKSVESANKESLKTSETNKHILTSNIPDSKEIIDRLPKVVTDHCGKKFIYLNGQKLEVLDQTPSLLPIKTGDKILEITKQTPRPKTEPVPPLKSVHLTKPRGKPSLVYAAPQFRSRQPMKLLPRKPTLITPPKLTGKIISINKHDRFQNLTSIMKKVGGSIRLVNEPCSPGIPLLKEILLKSKAPQIDLTAGDNSLDKMETGQCKCLKRNLVTVSTNTGTEESVEGVVTVSTNTEPVKSEHKEVQTDLPFNEIVAQGGNEESPLKELYSNDFIIGNDVNMGQGPPSLFASKEQNIKVKFFNDLQRCLSWESGNLPIHRGVIQQNLQEVKSQCVVLTARKAGIDIVNINNYTPLQLGVINRVSADIVKILLEYDADMSILDSEGNNVLHLAVEHNRTDLVRIFLDKLETSKLDIDHFNYDGLTPLMMCAFHNDRIDMAELFLKRGADLNLKDLKSGRTAIFHAAESYNSSMVLLLLDYGADTKIRNFFGISVHDAMFELDDIPKEIKYPILGRYLKVHEKRKLHQQKVRKQETFKRKKLEMVPTIQKYESKSNFIAPVLDV